MYKRQENGLLECSQKDFRAQMEEDGYSGELAAKVDEIFDGFLADAVDDMRAVSYTHLDVYKRQIQGLRDTTR